MIFRDFRANRFDVLYGLHWYFYNDAFLTGECAVFVLDQLSKVVNVPPLVAWHFGVVQKDCMEVVYYWDILQATGDKKTEVDISNIIFGPCPKGPPTDGENPVLNPFY